MPSIFDLVEQWQPLVAWERLVVQALSLSVKPPQCSIKVPFCQYEGQTKIHNCAAIIHTSTSLFGFMNWLINFNLDFKNLFGM